MASKNNASRPKKSGPTSGPPPASTVKRTGGSLSVAPAPKLATSPRKSEPGLSAPVKHVAPAKKELSAPVRGPAPKAAEKSLSPVRAHTPPAKPALSEAPPVAKPSIWDLKAAERAAKSSSPGPVAPVSAPESVAKPVLAPVAKPVAKRSVAPARPPTAEEVIARGYPQGFSSKKEFRDATRPMAKLARDGEVFVSGSSVTGVSYGRKNKDGTPAKFGPKSDIDVGIASRRLRADTSQVQQSGPGKSFPVEGSALEKTRGRTRERHPIGAKVFNGIPSERVVLKRSHTPVGERTDG